MKKNQMSIASRLADITVLLPCEYIGTFQPVLWRPAIVFEAMLHLVGTHISLMAGGTII